MGKGHKTKYIVGIDEVGRGCLAGPVMTAVVGIKDRIKLPDNLRDSKHLSKRKREEWLMFIKSYPYICFTTAYVSPRVIDRINVSKAANRAALRAFFRFMKIFKGKIKNIYLDGGLFLKNKEYQKQFNAKTIIGGDQKIDVIKLASIVAKLRRDRVMKKKGKIFPEYCFEIHKGYGTKLHFKALKKYGPCEIHRKTFIK
jgi:ribonuclease HII